MESGRGSGGGLRSGPGGKKMRKRKELDALVGGVGGGKRGGSGSKRAGSGGISPQDQLLSESTGEEDYWSAKGGKGRRRYVGNGSSRPGKPCQALLRACTVLLIMACLVATLTVMWLFIDIREQTTYLHNQLDQVAAGSQGVPDALQKCHSLSRELQSNQTKLFTQLASLSQHLSNFTAQIGIVQGGLANVEEKLMASPELVNFPHDLQALSSSVASFGSHIQDLQATSKNLKDEHSTILEKLKALQLNISGINKAVYDFSNTPNNGNQSNRNNDILDAEKKLESLVQDLKANVSSINETLSRKLQYEIDDQHNDHKVIDGLKEVHENVSSQIKTIQHEMARQQEKFTDIDKKVAETSNDVGIFKAHVSEANKQLGSLNDRWKKLENYTQSIGEELAHLRTSHESVEQNVTSTYTHRTNETSSTAGSEQHLSISSVGNMTAN